MNATDNFLKNMEKVWNEMSAKDMAAKESGELVGRYVSYQVADGHAYYEIKEINGESVTLEFIPYGDAYRHSLIEEMDCTMPLSAARKNVEMRDAMVKFFV